jgi:hypothetical protein
VVTNMLTTTEESPFLCKGNKTHLYNNRGIPRKPLGKQASPTIKAVLSVGADQPESNSAGRDKC